MLPVCARVAAVTNRRALYCSAEGQTAEELAAMLPCELDASPIETCCTQRLDDMMAHALELDVAIIVIDSIQSIQVEGVRLGDDEHARYLLPLFDKLSRASNAVIVAISQMSGQGRLRGSELYQQLCDTIAMLERVNELDELDDKGSRIRLTIDGKNRGGPVDRRAFFEFGDDGALRPAKECAHA
jgi:predicted ATP-dependent serine protease